MPTSATQARRAPATAAPAAPPEPPLAKAMSMLEQPLPRHTIAPLYMLNLAFVSVVMLVLPLVYLGLIAAVGYFVVLHATGQLMDFRDIRSARLIALLYVTPLAMGGLLLLFMIKPLFAPAPKGQANLALRREENRTLFEFVARLCRMIGAPEPREIRVDCRANASASFRRGILSFFGSDLTLTIGLPLVVALNLRQFTGVLAHEFGHFAQGAGMRLTYIIRSISFWFARVVYERDAWDEKLVQLTHDSPHWLINVIVGLSRLMIWTTRRILWVLMWAGQLVSGFMLRQMEYDADRYETRVSGSKTFADTCRTLPIIGLATDEAMGDLRRGWDEKRLCDDLLAVVRWNIKLLPDDVHKKVREHVDQQKTGLFDTHPADKDRIRAASTLAEKGVFTDEQPATILFDNFAGVSRLATMTFYQDVLGETFDPRYLVPAEVFCKGQDAQIERNKALRRFLQVRISPGRPVWLTAELIPSADNASAAEIVITARDQLLASIESFRAATKTFEDADDRVIKATLANALRQAGIEKFKPAEFGVRSSSAADVNLALSAATRDRTDAAQATDELHEVTRFRIEADLAISLTPEFAPELAKMGSDPTRIYTLLGAMDAVRRAHPTLMHLRDTVSSLGLLLRALHPENNSEAHIKKAMDLSSECVVQLRNLREPLSVASYPFEHSTPNASIALYAAEQIPPSDQVVAVCEVSEQAIEKLLMLYFRILADLTHLAERVEDWLGLPPLPEPRPDEEPAAETK